MHVFVCVCVCVACMCVYPRYVYDVNDPFERADILLDKNFFTANPTLGELVVQVILGDISDPNLYLLLFFIYSKCV